MALTHLLDTSVLARLSRPAVRAMVEPLAVAGSAARAGITDLEIGFSARNAREWDKLVASLSELQLVETTAAHLRPGASDAAPAGRTRSARTQDTRSADRSSG